MSVNVGPAVLALANTTLTVTRPGAVSGMTGGYVSTASATTFSIRALVHRIDGSESEWPAEGSRALARVAIYAHTSQTELMIPITGGNAAADLITWAGTSWKIVQKERWNDFGYFRYEAERILVP